jgi:hypothetical protein
MPPKGDRPSVAAAAPAKRAATPAKSATPEKGEKKGLFGGIKDFFSGGSKTKSGPTAANRPKARPDVVKTGTGKDTRYTDTKTGESYAAPTYGAFSLQGLTSTDPANVLRNRYGTDIRPMRGIEPANRNNRKDRGIASLVAPPTAPGAPGAAPTTEPTRSLPQYNRNASGFARLFRDIYSKQGLRGIFRGSLTRVLFHAPNTAITLTAYEQIKKAIDL